MGKKNKKKNIKSEQVIVEDYEKTLREYWLEGRTFIYDWFGVDKRGYIFYASSGELETIPKIINDNYELQLALKDYFVNMLDFSTSEVIKDYLYESKDRFEAFIEDYALEISLARKGIFYFHILEGYVLRPGEPEYEEFKKYPYFLKKIIAPKQPINISSLDYQIQKLMSLFVFDVDVNYNNYVYVDRKSKTYKYNLFKKISRE